jgi:hypothetical protein
MPLVDMSTCPVCGCDLAALPPPNHCPGCDFEYDEHTCVWRSSESWGRLAAWYAGVGLVAGLACVAFYRIRLEQAPHPAWPLLCLLVAPALGLLVRRILGGRITGRFVALTPAGIVVGTRPRAVVITWDNYDRLTEQRGVPKLQRHDSPVLLALDDIFATPEEYADFRAQLKAAARDHARPA